MQLSPENELFIENLKKQPCMVTSCGSQVTCNPAPTEHTDVDYLLYISPSQCGTAINAFIAAGFIQEGDERYFNDDGEFTSMRRGELNLIITDDFDFYEKHQVATYVCTQLNILDKQHRIMVFQAVLYAHKYKV